MIGIRVTGLTELEATCDALRAELDRENRKATEENLKDLKGRAVAKAPYKTGTLRRSIAYTQPETANGVTTGQVGSDLPYALLLEMGGFVPKEPYVHPNLFGKGIKAVMKPHYRAPRPYLFPSLVEGLSGFLYRYGQAWDRAAAKSRK